MAKRYRPLAWTDGAEFWAVYKTHLGCYVRERVTRGIDDELRLDVVLGGGPEPLEILDERDAGKTWP